MLRLKLVSIGSPLECGAFEVNEFGAAPTLSEYDAVVVDIEAISEFVPTTASGMSHLDGAGIRIVDKTTGTGQVKWRSLR